MNDTGHKKEKLESLLTTLAAEFLARESNRVSLITVTGVSLSPNRKYVTILFTAFPENKENEALDFVKRRIDDFRDYLKEKSRIGRIPFIEWKIDLGEKNRQKIEDISIRSRPSGEVG